MVFEDFKLNKQLLNACEDLEYITPTPIQTEVIPLALAGHDVLGIAQTGTGKTAAFGLPILMKIKYAQGLYPKALVLAPTRELAMQIAKNLQDLAKYTDIRVLSIYGGTGIQAQIAAVQKGIDILVATPGRLLDIYLKGELFFKEIKTLVLDEADKMMDMGFMHQIRKILEVIPSKKRQNLLFSATLPEKVISLTEEFLDFPIKIEITPSATTAETIAQSFYKVPNLKTKINLLEYFLADEDKFSRVMVFARTRKNAENLYKYLVRKYNDDLIKVIHANKGQNMRINAMEAFKNGSVRVLVATDVAARGIDAVAVSHVINFDVPIVYEDYVHRIGRTGRANQAGEAISFVNMAEEYHIKKIENLIKTKIPEIELPSVIEITYTPHEEMQEMKKAIDDQKKADNPDFKGAFHEKKESNKKPKITKKTKKDASQTKKKTTPNNFNPRNKKKNNRK
ncbi:MAG: DEAD/DEAH box helicase [Bacteroidetes bacterium]|nr:MAG: DEAD/DEAH box helicase [Bacteroidota bacterium]TAG90323.1 MAG: DEAD/DEAH box helicase [Bacteroidota bacterium]